MNDRQVLRGFIANIEVIPPLVVSFQYNPETVSDSKAVTYANRDADLCGNAPGKIYTAGGDRTISFDLKLHGLEQGTIHKLPTGVDNGILTELAKLRSFMYPKKDAFAFFGSNAQGKRIISPPTCLFSFGTKLLEGVITQMTITETQFNSALAPVRADVHVTIVVNEDSDNALYKLDTLHRNALAALGLANISLF